ncbi:ABC transporter permease [Arenibaculum pallidiluteum]|uniref:ABC transporter permease n=1 Tax=Arenibaculum pallidiluteum TaxID=2812559 RepID=UPI001A96D9FA|nr:iron ABC transporter permease [Arenibaculum pallidiluteum]
MRRAGAELWIGLAAAALVAALSLLPLLRLAVEAVDPELVRKTLSSPAVWRALGRSLETSLGGSVIALLLGAGFALAVGLTNLPARRMLALAVMLPLLIPSQIIVLAWIELFGPATRLLSLLGLGVEAGTTNPLYSAQGIMLLLGVEQAPIVFLAVRAALLATPRDLVEAARCAGAGGGRILGQIVLPLTLPALGAGFGLAFVACLGNFGIAALLGIPARYATLPVLIFQRLSGFGTSILAEAAVMAVALALVAGLGVLGVTWISRRRDSAVIGSASGADPLRFDLGRWAMPLGALLLAAALLMTAIPMAALAATSVTRAYGLALSSATFTLDHYARALAVPQTARALWNSLWMSGLSALLLAALAIPCAVAGLWARRRPVRRLFGLLGFVAELPYALPGVILGIAAILLYLRPLPVVNVTLYGTAGLIVIAYLARFMPLALRPVQVALLQVDRVLDEAAQAAGARYRHRLVSVAAPLVLPSAMAGALVVFLTAFNELTVSALLWSRGNETVGIVIYFLEEGGDTPGAAAVSMICVAFVFALAALATWLLPAPARRVLPWGR